MNNEIRQILIDNPDLPVYAWVGYEVCCGGEYSYWWADRIKAKVTEITQHKAGRYADSDVRVWERDDIDELRDDYIYDEPEIWLGLKNLNTSKSGPDVYAESDDEIKRLAQEYVDNLPWEKCILLTIDV